MYFFVSILWTASSASTLDGTRATDPLRRESYRMEGEITAEGLWLTSTATEGSAPVRPRLSGLMLAEPSIMDFPDLGLAQVASMSLTSVSVPLHPRPTLR